MVIIFVYQTIYYIFYSFIIYKRKILEEKFAYIVFSVQEGAEVLFFIFSIVMKAKGTLMLTDSELLTCEMF